MGVSNNSGPLFGSYNKHHSILGSILGPLSFLETPKATNSGLKGHDGLLAPGGQLKAPAKAGALDLGEMSSVAV